MARANTAFLLRWCVDVRRYPPVIRRQLAWATIIALIAGIAGGFVLLVFLGSPTLLSGIISAMVVVVMIPLCLLSLTTFVCLLFGLAHHREDVMCGRCRYSLSGLDDRGHCPECGDPYCSSRIKWYWARMGRELTPARTDYLGVAGMWIGILAAMFLLPSLFSSVVIYSLIIWHFGIKTSLRAGILRRRVLRSDYALCRACHSTLAASHGNTVCAKCGRTCDMEATKRAWNEELPPHWEEDVAEPCRRTVTGAGRSCARRRAHAGTNCLSRA